MGCIRIDCGRMKMRKRLWLHEQRLMQYICEIEVINSSKYVQYTEIRHTLGNVFRRHQALHNNVIRRIHSSRVALPNPNVL